MPIYSQHRADMYNAALKKPRTDAADLSGTPPHLLSMLYERSGKTEITYGDIVYHFAPTFEEARTLGVLRAHVLNTALDKLDKGHHYFFKQDVPPEVTDFMFDRLPNGQPPDYFVNWDVIEALRPSMDEVRQETKRWNKERTKRTKCEIWSIMDGVHPVDNDDGDDEIPF